MYCIKKVTDDMYYIGSEDRRIALFENAFPLENGISYNSYFLSDEKTVVFDTVDKSVSSVFFGNIAYLLNGRKLDYVVVNHVEPDHSATLSELVLRYPDVKIVTNAKAAVMINNFFNFDLQSRLITITENDTLTTGKHTFKFITAPMVHWPEVMLTYDETDKILYCADAFGSFGTLNGLIFADNVDYDRDWIDESRRYYSNIVGKYGAQVQAVLKKASTLKIKMLCPLHGHIWRKNIDYIIDKYNLWSSYQPESKSVLIAYASIYGNTENAVNILAGKLSDGGINDIKIFDVSKTHPSYIVAEAFRCSHLIFASSTYNTGIFSGMETLLLDLKAHNLQNRTVSVIENGTWAATAGKQMKEIISSMKNMTVIDESAKIMSSVKADSREQLTAVADRIIADFAKEDKELKDVEINPNAMFKLSYGLFLLSAKDGEFDNGCIINTVSQVTDNPKRITFAVNKANYTCEIIDKNGEFTVSVLTESAPFGIFERFGFASGRDKNKFDGLQTVKRSNNGTLYLTEHTNAYISGKVTQKIDCGTHILFIADVIEADILNDEESVTYSYYFKNIKPKPEAQKKKGFVCKICGYVYEGEELPPDFICPWCKHGADDFEPLG